MQEKKDQTVSKEEGTYTFPTSIIPSRDFISESAGMDLPLSEEREDVEGTDGLKDIDDVEETDDIEGTDDVVVPGLF